ncbi:hypothetical protein [Bailinhaonella thermotolerans]|uniref:Uncharacterized protein n=1 Tax=Bailinhaonella thermotolerans TaxID=1070861 RepID=A0A3A4A4K6_9ACTN|nr:hypothetical protein [Bailinhaonella thermotolerans]RJL19974.1 hypothetical protein D5H75_40000 [Bailinhaonella thermotolerans]
MTKTTGSAAGRRSRRRAERERRRAAGVTRAEWSEARALGADEELYTRLREELDHPQALRVCRSGLDLARYLALRERYSAERIARRGPDLAQAGHCAGCLTDPATRRKHDGRRKAAARAERAANRSLYRAGITWALERAAAEAGAGLDQVAAVPRRQRFGFLQGVREGLDGADLLQAALIGLDLGTYRRLRHGAGHRAIVDAWWSGVRLDSVSGTILGALPADQVRRLYGEEDLARERRRHAREVAALLA